VLSFLLNMFTIVLRTIVRMFVIATLLCALIPGAALSVEQCDAPVSLLDKYHTLEEPLARSVLGMPVYLDSNVEKNSSSADIYGVIDRPFDAVEKELSSPADWCDIILPHINIRACTSSNVGDTWHLTLYNVTRYHQPIEEAVPLKYIYRLVARQSGYLDILFSADDGPFHTHDHRLRIEAAPVGENRTFVHLSYFYRYGSFAYMAMKSYFGLFGRSKVGFSTSGTDAKSGPIYVSGLNGVVERNVMRYYLAVLAYMDTLKYPAEQRFEKRISHWYDLTTRYKRQLFEMEKKDYLDYKRRDLKNQTQLQNASKAK
jgi:hypothetical protein